MTKIPVNSDELLIYTVEKIKEQTQKQKISKPAEPHNFYKFCQGCHNLLNCKVLLEKDEKEKAYGFRQCYICRESHDFVNCKLTQVVDLTSSLTDIEQQKVYEVCPYLNEPIQYPKHSLVCMFAWATQKYVEIIDPHNFTLPYCKKRYKNLNEEG